MMVLRLIHKDRNKCFKRQLNVSREVQVTLKRELAVTFTVGFRNDIFSGRLLSAIHDSK